MHSTRTQYTTGGVLNRIGDGQFDKMEYEFIGVIVAGFFLVVIIIIAVIVAYCKNKDGIARYLFALICNSTIGTYC